MRVLMLCHYLPPHVGGIETVASNEAAALATSGHDVVVATSDQPRRSPAPEPSGRGVRLRRCIAYNGLERRTGVPYPVFGPGLIRAAWQESAGADVVHVHDTIYLTSLVGALCAKRRGARLVVSLHVGLVDHPNPVVMAAQRLAHATIGRVVLRDAGAVLAIDEGVADHARRRGVAASQITVVPNGVDPDVFAPPTVAERHEVRSRLGLPDGRPLFLFVGRFVPKKGFDRLLGAVDDRYTLVFAGGDAPAGIGTDDRVVFLGALPQSRLAEVYRACDLLVAPSVGEGLTLTMLEAMASGLPIVLGRNARYLPADLDPLGVAVLPGDSSEAIRSTLAALAVDGEALARMRAYSLGLVADRYTWPAHTAALLHAYRPPAP